MIDRLVEKIKETGAPIVVGLDPMLKYVPEQVQQKAFRTVRRDAGGRGGSHLAV